MKYTTQTATSCTCVGSHDGSCALRETPECQHGVPFAEACHSGNCFRDRQPDKSVLVHAFIERHLTGGDDNYVIALLLEKAGYTFRDLVDALIASRGM